MAKLYFVFRLALQVLPSESAGGARMCVSDYCDCGPRRHAGGGWAWGCWGARGLAVAAETPLRYAPAPCLIRFGCEQSNYVRK